MRKSVIKGIFSLALSAMRSIGARSLDVGEKAPPFEAPSNRGIVRLADYLGKRNVLLAFYFVDFTPV